MEEKGVIINCTRYLKHKHVCYFTMEGTDLHNNKIRLMEVIDVLYDHPEAPGIGSINSLETRLVKEFYRHSNTGGIAVVMEAQQNAVKHFVSTNNLKRELSK